MNSGGTIIWLIVLIGVAFIPANMAKKKGYSFGGFYVFGFFIPLVAIIVAACLRDKSHDDDVRPVYGAPPPTYGVPPYGANVPPYGAPVAPPPYSTPPQPPKPDAPAALPEKVCAYCGTKALGDSTVCNSCGARF